MSEHIYEACTTGRDKRFPITPRPEDRIGMMMRPVRPSTRERFRARNGPPIDDWEIALIGREGIKEGAADTVSGPSLHATLDICGRKAQGALGRIPVEIWLRIEKILYDTTFKRSDLPIDTRFHPGGFNMRASVGRLNVYMGLDENGNHKKVVKKVDYG